MAKSKKKKKNKKQQKSDAAMHRRDRNAAYRAALGVGEGKELPKTLGTTESAGGASDSRRNMGETKNSKGATRSRVKLIG